MDDNEPLSPSQARAEDDMRRYQANIEKPATRSELLRVLSQCHLALVSHSLFAAGVAEGVPEEDLRFLGEKTLDHADRLRATMRAFLHDWQSEDE